jgi:hypothetical protein
MALLQRSSLSQGHSRNTRIRPSPQQRGPAYVQSVHDFSASVSGSACNVQSIWVLRNVVRPGNITDWRGYVCLAVFGGRPDER